MEKTLDWTLLWENPSPAVSFVSQNIPLDLSEYRAIAVLARTYVSSDYQTILPVVIAPKGTTGVIIGIAGTTAGYTGNFYFQVREFVVNADKVAIHTAVGGADNATIGKNNSLCIPYQIYGIRYAG